MRPHDPHYRRDKHAFDQRTTDQVTLAFIFSRVHPSVSHSSAGYFIPPPSPPQLRIHHPFKKKKLSSVVPTE